MKGIFVGLSMAAALALFSGCASTAPVGALYTDASLPITARRLLLVGLLRKVKRLARVF